MKNIIFTIIIFSVLYNLLFVYNAKADSRLEYCEPYREQIIAILESEGLPSEYFYLAVCESRCKIDVVSNKGAVGLFQVTKPTYIHYKPSNCSNDDIDDLECNTRAAARYIKHLQHRFKDMKTLVKAYNRGGTNLIRKGSTREADGLSYCVMSYVKKYSANKNNKIKTK